MVGPTVWPHLGTASFLSTPGNRKQEVGLAGKKLLADGLVGHGVKTGCSSTANPSASVCITPVHSY